MVDDLAKTCADGTEAVRGVTIRFAARECYAQLGSDGAGKSAAVPQVLSCSRSRWRPLPSPSGGSVYARRVIAGFERSAISWRT